jgi:hypothetical protein
MYSKGELLMSEQTRKQTFKVQAHDLANQVKNLIEEGNARRIVIRQGERTVADIPLTVGVVGTLFAPWAAAVGALAALISDCTIEVTHDEANTDATPTPTAAVDSPAPGPQVS